MVDAFCGIIDGCSTTCLTVRPDNIFVAGGRLDESGVMEHIAQSAAARHGYECLAQGRDVPLGFIGSVEKLRLDALPAVGDTLTTRINIIQEIFGITLVEAHTVASPGNRAICSCRMKIFIDYNHEKKA